MTIGAILILLLVAGICGAVGQAIAGYSLGGFLVSIGIGFIGAWVGIWLANALHLPDFFALSIGGYSFPVIWAIIGSALFVALISIINRARWRHSL